MPDHNEPKPLTHLWARFDVSCDSGDQFHLLTSDLSIADYFGVEFACDGESVMLERGTTLRDVLIEASRTVEHRKKCPACYEYWMIRREQQQRGLNHV